jgi:hypothetical protein
MTALASAAETRESKLAVYAILNHLRLEVLYIRKANAATENDDKTM